MNRPRSISCGIACSSRACSWRPRRRSLRCADLGGFGGAEGDEARDALQGCDDGRARAREACPRDRERSPRLRNHRQSTLSRRPTPGGARRRWPEQGFQVAACRQPGQQHLAGALTRAIETYIRDFANPVVQVCSRTARRPVPRNHGSATSRRHQAEFAKVSRSREGADREAGTRCGCEDQARDRARRRRNRRLDDPDPSLRPLPRPRHCRAGERGGRGRRQARGRRPVGPSEPPGPRRGRGADQELQRDGRAPRGDARRAGGSERAAQGERAPEVGPRQHRLARAPDAASGVMGFTKLLLTREFDPETRRHYLGIVDAQAAGSRTCSTTSSTCAESRRAGSSAPRSSWTWRLS